MMGIVDKITKMIFLM